MARRMDEQRRRAAEERLTDPDPFTEPENAQQRLAALAWRKYAQEGDDSLVRELGLLK